MYASIAKKIEEGGSGKKLPEWCSEYKEDTNKNCAYWASVNQCEKNPAYMKLNCRASCCVEEPTSATYTPDTNPTEKPTEK